MKPFIKGDIYILPYCLDVYTEDNLIVFVLPNGVVSLLSKLYGSLLVRRSVIFYNF